MLDCYLSIVTIAKNDRSGLYNTLESVRQQDYQYIEHIVVDGDSTDGSKELLATYNHSKTYIYCSEPDFGISDAFNKGVVLSSGQIILFLNSGDVLCSTSIISDVVASYTKEKWLCAQGGVISSNYEGNEVTYLPPKLPAYFLKYFMFLPHQGFFCDLTLQKQYRFDEAIQTTMDYDLFLRMLQETEIFYLPFIIAKCQSGGVSSQSRLRILEQAQIRLRHTNTYGERLLVHLLNSIILLKNHFKIDSPFARR